MINKIAEEFVYDGVTYIKFMYEFILEKDNFKEEFTDEEKLWCRPIAETLAMMDGNAFFNMDVGNDKEIYEGYLPEAWAIFVNNGGISGWASETIWMRDLYQHESPEVKEAYNQWRTLKALSKG